MGILTKGFLTPPQIRGLILEPDSQHFVGFHVPEAPGLSQIPENPYETLCFLDILSFRDPNPAPEIAKTYKPLGFLDIFAFGGPNPAHEMTQERYKTLCFLAVLTFRGPHPAPEIAKTLINHWVSLIFADPGSGSL